MFNSDLDEIMELADTKKHDLDALQEVAAKNGDTNTLSMLIAMRAGMDQLATAIYLKYKY